MVEQPYSWVSLPSGVFKIFADGNVGYVMTCDAFGMHWWVTSGNISICEGVSESFDRARQAVDDLMLMRGLQVH
jgi:hypothetical protein